MNLSPARFNRFLHRIGQRVDWRPSHACPCRQAYSGTPDPACLYCGGKGRRWGAAQASLAGISSRDIARQLAPMAILDSGDVMLIIPSDEPVYAIGEYDRVSLTDRTEPFSLNLIAGVNVPLHWDPVALDAVSWIVDGDLIEQPRTWETVTDPATGETSTVETTPWTLDSHHRPVWDPDADPYRGPPAETPYVITGRRHPEYFCYLTLALDRPHHAGAALPRRVVLRRFDLFGA